MNTATDARIQLLERWAVLEPERCRQRPGGHQVWLEGRWFVLKACPAVLLAAFIEAACDRGFDFWHEYDSKAKANGHLCIVEAAIPGMGSGENERPSMGQSVWADDAAIAFGTAYLAILEKFR